MVRYGWVSKLVMASVEFTLLEPPKTASSRTLDAYGIIYKDFKWEWWDTRMFRCIPSMQLISHLGIIWYYTAYVIIGIIQVLYWYYTHGTLATQQPSLPTKSLS